MSASGIVVAIDATTTTVNIAAEYRIAFDTTAMSQIFIIDWHDEPVGLTKLFRWARLY
jgi:hypothetical protein